MKDKIRAAIRADLAEGEFEAIACAAADLQRAANPLLDRAAVTLPVRGARPWMRIPLLPVRAFKEHRVACFPPDEEAAVFRSSGTTGPPGLRPVRDLDLYGASVRAGFALAFPSAPSRRVALLPRPEEAPDSSLVRMAAILGCEFSERPPAGGGAVFLLGTAVRFSAVLASGDARPLPSGSLVVETGGYKGTKISVPRAMLHARLAGAFGAEIRSEYGMSETFSQGWTFGPAPVYRFPPWCRVRILDPATLDDAAEGLVALYDLANFDASIGLLTEDVGRAAGENAFAFLGRATGAEARGCSLAW